MAGGIGSHSADRLDPAVGGPGADRRQLDLTRPFLIQGKKSFHSPEKHHVHVSVELRAPIRRLTFFSAATYQKEWLEPDFLLAFRCEFVADEARTGHPVRALLFARLAVDRARIFTYETARYEFGRVEDLDFVVSLDGETVYEAYGARPMEEDKGLAFKDETGCWATIRPIVSALKQAVRDENP
ncbi:hypothetical protein ABZS96_14630 [Streptomyces avermitilis]|uniref:hypothetical protein n=1 Tax=Streptomyces avermitilis TaxID=33903 RepID=UPI0033A68DAF